MVGKVPQRHCKSQMLTAVGDQAAGGLVYSPTWNQGCGDDYVNVLALRSKERHLQQSRSTITTSLVGHCLPA